MTGGIILIASLTALLSAQVLKFVLALVQERKMNFRFIVTAGGMPSTHTAFTVCLSTCVGLVHGWDSTLFAVCVVFTLVVMYDAAGVRRAAGRQAHVLNKIMDELSTTQRISEERLKELLGHTPLEVFGGALYGVLMALLFFAYGIR